MFYWLSGGGGRVLNTRKVLHTQSCFSPPVYRIQATVANGKIYRSPQSNVPRYPRPHYSLRCSGRGVVNVDNQSTNHTSRTRGTLPQTDYSNDWFSIDIYIYAEQRGWYRINPALALRVSLAYYRGRRLSLTPPYVRTYVQCFVCVL